MRRRGPSVTAMGIALLRALEGARPEDERVCYDPYARRFIPGWFYWMGWFFTSIGYADLRGPGVQGFLAARERHIDEILLSAIDDGIKQLVILGAGYDSRAYRFDGLKNKVKVLEVDHPSTQEDKLKKVEKIFERVPEHVSYVGIDFNRQSLEGRLLASGYDPSLKTLFIWQGVTYYLTPEAVDQTLAFIANKSGAGSRVIFDYVNQSVLQGSQQHGEVKSMHRYRRLTSESLTFGIPNGTIKDFMETRGFCQVENVDNQDLHGLYFTGKRKKRKVASGYGIVSAVVQTPYNRAPCQ